MLSWSEVGTHLVGFGSCRIHWTWYRWQWWWTRWKTAQLCEQYTPPQVQFYTYLTCVSKTRVQSDPIKCVHFFVVVFHSQTLVTTGENPRILSHTDSHESKKFLVRHHISFHTNWKTRELDWILAAHLELLNLIDATKNQWKILKTVTKPDNCVTFWGQNCIQFLRHLNTR